jgi:hypothetical protein
MAENIQIPCLSLSDSCFSTLALQETIYSLALVLEGSLESDPQSQSALPIARPVDFHPILGDDTPIGIHSLFGTLTL